MGYLFFKNQINLMSVWKSVSFFLPRPQIQIRNSPENYMLLIGDHLFFWQPCHSKFQFDVSIQPHQFEPQLLKLGPKTQRRGGYINGRIKKINYQISFSFLNQILRNLCSCLHHLWGFTKVRLKIDPGQLMKIYIQSLIRLMEFWHLQDVWISGPLIWLIWPLSPQTSPIM